ncbi:hypothetical protein F5Y02DRAFT_401683 [Annulohypoxylon stygium]|nr:hypothetical protein F5Y02DRAFT_401683 [Annulohypoxylon stygium]
MANPTSPLEVSSKTMLPFPNEIFDQIFSLTTFDALLNCRLANKNLCSLATPWVFRQAYLEAAGDMSRFVNISRTPRLRSCICEVTIDTHIWPLVKYGRNETFKFPFEFFVALPNLRLFSGLKKLNLNFVEACGGYHDEFKTTEENYDFRYYVMWNVFSCLTGDWTAQFSFMLYDELEVPVVYEGDEEVDPDKVREEINSAAAEIAQIAEGLPSAIELETLTICNLAAYDETRLTRSDLFKQVLSSVTDLRLCFLFEEHESIKHSALWFEEQYDFTESLHKTWLARDVAKNLHTLYLHSSTHSFIYWGWFPRMDFRDVNRGPGPESGFPKLEVLALGKYVFSHEWQIEWFASLGRQNGHGGLRQLYLDDCPILSSACVWEKLDEKPGFVGYPRKNAMLSFEYDDQWYTEGTEVPYSLRWHHILSYWKANMTALKVFEAGNSSWGSYLELLAKPTYPKEWVAAREQEKTANDADFTFDGAVQYIEYDQAGVPCQWSIDEPGPRDAQDVQALDDFHLTIESRNRAREI